jgi:integrase
VTSPADRVKESVDLVRSLIEQGILDPAALGLRPAEKATDLVPGRRVKLRDLEKEIETSFRTSTKRTYMPYIEFLVHGWAGHQDVFAGYGDAWVDEVLPSQLDVALGHIQTRARLAVERRNAAREAQQREPRKTGGTSPEYNAVGAWRRLFQFAIDNRHLAAGYNPADKVTKPARIDGTRVALTQSQYDQLWDFIDSSGDDPQLDRMLCETIVISGARVEGLLNLTLRGIDVEECTLLLDEKFGQRIHQPVPDWFAKKLRDFAVARGAARYNDPVFIKRAVGKRAATPITDRRFDNVFTQRLQSAFVWADKQQVGAHTLRHHAVTVVERHANKAVARAFARHKAADVNDIYTQATRVEVARAIVELYGGDHPWLHREPRVAK